MLQELARVGLDLNNPRPEVGGFTELERAEGAREKIQKRRRNRNRMHNFFFSEREEAPNDGGCAVFSHSMKSENFSNKSRSNCPFGRGSLVADPEGSTLETLIGTEEEADAETDAKTGAETETETGVEISETGSLKMVEGADNIVLGVLGMMY